MTGRDVVCVTLRGGNRAAASISVMVMMMILGIYFLDLNVFLCS